MFQLFKRLFNVEPPAGRKRHPLVIVAAVLQIAFGALSICGPIMHFAGVQQMMMRVQSSLQAQVPKPPNQPDFGPDKVDALLHKYAPWIDTYNNAINAVSLLLCLMMIFAGFGLLRMERWAWWVTLAYALASIGFAIFQAAFAFNYMGPMMTGMMNEILDELPAPRPGQPDPRQMLSSPGSRPCLPSCTRRWSCRSCSCRPSGGRLSWWRRSPRTGRRSRTFRPCRPSIRPSRSAHSGLV
jgi:hypothetical protein